MATFLRTRYTARIPRSRAGGIRNGRDPEGRKIQAQCTILYGSGTKSALEEP